MWPSKHLGCIGKHLGYLWYHVRYLSYLTKREVRNPPRIKKEDKQTANPLDYSDIDLHVKIKDVIKI